MRKKRYVYKVLRWDQLNRKWIVKKISPKEWRLLKIRFKNDARLNGDNLYETHFFEKTVAGYHFTRYNILYDKFIHEYYLTKEEA